jgi:acyl dehydratase
MTLFPRAPHWWFEDIVVGRTWEFGAAKVTAEDVALFHERFAPTMQDKAPEAGREANGPRAAESHVYAILQRQAQDALRFYKAVYAGDVLSVRMAFAATEDRGPQGGILISEHEVMDQDGLLVMSVIMRSLLAKKPADLPEDPEP